MSKICLTCKINDKMNDGKIPKWYKEIGNDSLLPPILNNNKSYSLDNKKNFVNEIPNITDISVIIEVDKEPADKWLFYWAADPQDTFSLINDAKTAYNNEENHGMIKTDKEGNAKLQLNCPQPYKVDNLTYPRHVHYTFLTSEKTWNENIHSMVVMCDIDYETLREYSNNRSHIVINALESEDHKKRGIPGTINMYYKDLSELSKQKRKKHIKSVLKRELKHYSNLNALINSKKLTYKELPIIVYCEGEKCESSKLLSEYLIDSGYVNIAKYSGGLRDWSKKTGNNPDINTIEYDGNEYIVEDDEVMDPDTYVIVGKLEDGEVKLFDTDEKNETEDDLMGGKYKTEIVVNKIGGDIEEEKKEIDSDSDNESDSDASSSESDISDLEENERFVTIDSDDDNDNDDNNDNDDDNNDNDDVDESDINELSNNDSKSNNKEKKGGNPPSPIQNTNFHNRFISIFRKYPFTFY